jgi:hypothetical protein
VDLVVAQNDSLTDVHPDSRLRFSNREMEDVHLLGRLVR